MNTNNANLPNTVFPWLPLEILQCKKSKSKAHKCSAKMSRVTNLSQTLIHVSLVCLIDVKSNIYSYRKETQKKAEPVHVIQVEHNIRKACEDQAVISARTSKKKRVRVNDS